ncbi:hypothetical protein ABTZ99_02230 [Actinosynnema sp. NPDC002837]
MSSRTTVDRTVVVVDVEGFGGPARPPGIPADLGEVVAGAFRTAGVPWHACRHEDRGGGLLVLVPPEVPKAPLVEVVPNAVARALRAHDRTGSVRVRVAVHSGEVVLDEDPITSGAVTTAFRLLDATPPRTAPADSSGLVALIVSEPVFDEVVRRSEVLDPAAFRPVPVRVGGGGVTAWVALPDTSRLPDPVDGRSTDNRTRDVVGNVIQAGTIGQVTHQSPALTRWQVLIATGVAVLLVAAVVVAAMNGGDVTINNTNSNNVVIPETSQPAPDSSVAFQGGFDGCATFYYSPSQADKALVTADVDELADSAEGREVMPIRITAQAKGEEDVLLTGMRLVESTVSPPPTTGVLLTPNCGGSSVTPRNFEADLDRPYPVVKPIPMIGDEPGEDDSPAVPFPFKISAHDPEVFDLHLVRAQPCDCRFAVEVDWVVHGRRGTSRVDDGGTAFRFIAGDTVPRYTQDATTRAWVRE